MPSTMKADHIPAPAVRDLLGPLLPSLPAAAFSTQPAPAILRLLSPILRQRVQIFSGSSNEPWLRLLCYDQDKAAKLGEVAREADLEPHPVSGEVEVDWDEDVETRYRRLDKETIQALVAFKSLNLAFQLVYCTRDKEGGGDGWRVGEVTIPDRPSPFSNWGGMSALADAEADFQEKEASKKAAEVYKSTNGLANGYSHDHLKVDKSYGTASMEDEDEDDAYWARYDATPARTPATKQSPAPTSTQQNKAGPGSDRAAEDAYFALYSDVQPAMDNHDPDEAANMKDIQPEAGHTNGVVHKPEAVHPESFEPKKSALEPEIPIAPPLGLARVLNNQSEPAAADAEETNRVWSMVEKETRASEDLEKRFPDLHHPKPESSSSSTRSRIAMEKLEESADRKSSGEFAIKQHIGRTVRSLFSLSRAAGIDKAEFEHMVKTEIDMLGMMEDEEQI